MTMHTPPHQPASPRARLAPLLNTLIVAAGYMLSRVLGLARDIIISAQFGTLPEYGAYRATFGLLDLIYIVVAGGALGSAFIPVFAGLLEQRDEQGAWRLASGLLTLASAGLLLACALIGLLAEPIVALTIGRGFEPAQRELTVQLLRLLLVQPVLLGLGGLAKATLETFDRFTLPAVGANLYNLGIIGGALLAPWLGIYGLVWGVIAGALLFLLVQLPGLRAVGARYVLVRSTKDTKEHEGIGKKSPFVFLRVLRGFIRATPGLDRVARLLAPRLFGQAAWQINLIAIGSFASLLGTAAVAANGYALTLMLLPHGLVALSLGTVIFPQLARLHAAGDHAAFRTLMIGALRGVLFLALPAAALLAALAGPIVRVLFERGRFGADSTALTAQALVCYALGLAAFAAAEIVVRAFYALHDTRTPVIVGCAMVLLNIALGWLLLRAGAGLPGLALAFSIANIAEAVALLLLIARRLGRLGAAFWQAGATMLLGALLAGGAAWGLREASAAWLPALDPLAAYRWPADFLALAIWLAGVGLLAAAIYGGATWLIGLAEPHTTIERIRRLGRHKY